MEVEVFSLQGEGAYRSSWEEATSSLPVAGTALPRAEVNDSPLAAAGTASREVATCSSSGEEAGIHPQLQQGLDEGGGEKCRIGNSCVVKTTWP